MVGAVTGVHEKQDAKVEILGKIGNSAQSREKNQRQEQRPGKH